VRVSEEGRIFCHILYRSVCRYAKEHDTAYLVVVGRIAGGSFPKGAHQYQVDDGKQPQYRRPVHGASGKTKHQIQPERRLVVLNHDDLLFTTERQARVCPSVFLLFVVVVVAFVFVLLLLLALPYVAGFVVC